MRWDRQKYPPDWEARRRAVRERAGNRCEHCGLFGGQPHPLTGKPVILATAHRKPPRTDCRLTNLLCLCGGCHLRHDREQHAFNRRRNREEKRRREQPVLLDVR